jgi:predicted porin
MKKTIIAASIAAVVAAPAAFADVSVYGKVHMDITDADGSSESITSNASRFGVNSSEDLGNGMKAFAKMEWGTDTVDGGTAVTTADGSTTTSLQFTARDAYVGLSGDFGKVMLGRMGGPNKAVLYGTGNVQVADSVADFADGFEAKSSSSSFGRVSNALAYANSFNGVNVTLATVGNDTDDNFAHTAFALSTDVAGAHIAVAHTDIDGTKTGNIFGAKMSFGDLTAGVVYEEVDFDAAATEDYDTTGISLSYKMGNTVLAVSTSTRDFSGSTVDTDRTNFSIEHKFSKNTSVYIANNDVDAATDSGNTAVGIIHSF